MDLQLIQLLDLLLLVEDCHHLRVVVAVLFCCLSVIEVNQHVGQVLVQSVLNVVSVLLGLTPLGTLRLLIVLLLLGCLLRPLVLRVLLRMASSLVRRTGTTLVIGVIMGLLVIRVLGRLPLVLRLLILACIGRLCLSRPLVLVFDLVT